MNAISRNIEHLLLAGIIFAALISPSLPRDEPFAVRVANPVALAPTPRWEYKIEAIPDALFEVQMRALGNEGWELVFARRASNGGIGTDMTLSYECIFKRLPRR